MARVIEPITDEQLKQITVANLRKEYKKIADFYRKIINNEIVYCSHCRNWKTVRAFYESAKSPDGIEHYACKECILNECTDVGKNGIRSDNKEKTIETFRKLDWYFDEKVYNDLLQKILEGVGEKIKSTAVQQWITMNRSINDYKFKSFSDSIFDIEDIEGNDSPEDIRIIQKTLKKAKKRFGSDYSNEDLMFLENEYQDWVSRYECSQKAQEETFENLSILKLMKRNAIKKGLSTKDIDKSYQDWLDTGKLKPKQNSLDTFSDAQTLGTLIQKYEETRPLPEIDPELEDVDKIGLYIDAFYRGHASKMLGLKNRFSNIYEKVMSKYTVTPPSYDEESDSEILFDKIFGNKEE
ncbi:MAG: hypothetical protein KHY19_08080 [Coprobacillus cateniformis]|nr:hypothetical protein [Coprobacillus cateniformis]